MLEITTVPSLGHWLWQLIAGVLTLGLSAAVSAHIVLNKRDVRSAIGWVGLVWLVPGIGAVLYLLLGINRIQRRAGQLRGERLHARAEHRPVVSPPSPAPVAVEQLGRSITRLAHMVHSITHFPLTEGNEVRTLVNGDTAYEAMLAALNEARESIVLSTYIFGNDAVGERFVASLAEAVARGVRVRVLIDGVGIWYSLPPVLGELRRRGVPVARFLHSPMPWRMPFLNLRNHRKILVVDGAVGFTGGMNIRGGHPAPERSIQDLHFQLRGPILQHLVQAFAEDWAFTTGESLAHPQWRPDTRPVGPVRARGIVDGPDEDLDRLRWTLLAALNEAEQSVRILTPYFLPDQTLIHAINLTALRGVEVEIVLPIENNLPFVGWAAAAQLGQLLEGGCRVYFTPPPFDHSKLMIVDDVWSLMGSANWDPRSLRLNFEFNVECYGQALASELSTILDAKRDAGQALHLDELQARPMWTKLRDGLAWLLTPYL